MLRWIGYLRFNQGLRGIVLGVGIGMWIWIGVFATGAMVGGREEEGGGVGGIRCGWLVMSVGGGGCEGGVLDWE